MNYKWFYSTVKLNFIFIVKNLIPSIYLGSWIHHHCVYPARASRHNPIYIQRFIIIQTSLLLSQISRRRQNTGKTLAAGYYVTKRRTCRLFIFPPVARSRERRRIRFCVEVSDWNYWHRWPSQMESKIRVNEWALISHKQINFQSHFSINRRVINIDISVMSHAYEATFWKYKI